MLTTLENLAKNLPSLVCVDPTTRIWESHIPLSEMVENQINFIGSKYLIRVNYTLLFQSPREMV